MIYLKQIDGCQKHSFQHRAGLDALFEGVRREYGYILDEKDISFEERGKPFFPDYPYINFSISHCRGLAVCLINNSRCGIDAEPILPARDNVARRVFSAVELSAYEKAQGKVRDKLFTTLWTLKEAYSKTDGGGIAVMKKICFDPADNFLPDNIRYSFYTDFFKNYVLSVCIEGSSIDKENIIIL